MFKIKVINFDKIRSMVDAASHLDDADETEKAQEVLKSLADFILTNQE